MMDVVSPGLVGWLVRHELGRFGDKPKERVHSDGKVRAPYQACAVLFDDRTHRIEMFEPACRAHYDVYAERRDPLDVLHRRVWDGNIDRDLEAAEVLRGARFEV